MKHSMLALVFVCVAATAFAQAGPAEEDTTSSGTAPAPAPQTKEPEAKAPEKAAAPAPAETSSAVRRAIFCSGIADREPVDTLTTVAAPAAAVTFFTELVGLEGSTVTHRWTYGGETVAEVPISVGANRWRCYSTKTLDPAHTGEWTVQIIGGDGTTLGQASITYTAP